MARKALAALFFLLLPAGLAADQVKVYLIDGTIIIGELLEMNDAEILVKSDMSPAPLRISRTQIRKLEFINAASDVTAPPPPPPPNTGSGVSPTGPGNNTSTNTNTNTNTNTSGGGALTITVAPDGSFTTSRENGGSTTADGETTTEAGGSMESSEIAGEEVAGNSGATASTDPASMSRASILDKMDYPTAAESLKARPFLLYGGVSFALDLVEINPDLTDASEQALFIELGFEYSLIPYIAFAAEASFFVANPGDYNKGTPGFSARVYSTFRLPVQKRYIPGIALGLGFAPVFKEKWARQLGVSPPSVVYWLVSMDLIRFRWNSVDVSALTFGFMRRFGMPTKDEGYDKGPFAFSFSLIRVGWAFGKGMRKKEEPKPAE